MKKWWGERGRRKKVKNTEEREVGEKCMVDKRKTEVAVKAKHILRERQGARLSSASSEARWLSMAFTVKWDLPRHAKHTLICPLKCLQMQIIVQGLPYHWMVFSLSYTSQEGWYESKPLPFPWRRWILGYILLFNKLHNPTMSKWGEHKSWLL